MASAVARLDTWQEHGTYQPCPMCGSTDPQDDAEPERFTPAQAIGMIALMAEANPIGTDTILMRTVRGWTFEAIGMRHGVTRQAVEQSMADLSDQFPSIRSLLAGSPRTNGKGQHEAQEMGTG